MDIDCALQFYDDDYKYYDELRPLLEKLYDTFDKYYHKTAVLLDIIWKEISENEFIGKNEEE
jgi:hypothetical protein